MKETYYFSHDYNARNDEKILELRSEFKSDGYAAYFMMLESMAENEDSGLNRVAIGGLSLGYNIPKGKLEKIIQKAVDIGLFVEEGSRFYSPRMREHKEFRLSLSEAGKLGAKKRWGEKKNSPPNAPPNAKERKGKERKGNTLPTVKTKPKVDIDKLFEDIQKETGVPAVAGQGSRRYAYNFLRKLKKTYPDQNENDLAMKVVQLAVALEDNWHATKAHNPKHLFYNWQEIIVKSKGKAKSKEIKSF